MIILLTLLLLHSRFSRIAVAENNLYNVNFEHKQMSSLIKIKVRPCLINPLQGPDTRLKSSYISLRVVGERSETCQRSYRLNWKKHFVSDYPRFVAFATNLTLVEV